MNVWRQKAWAGSLLFPPGPHGLSFTFCVQSYVSPCRHTHGPVQRPGGDRPACSIHRPCVQGLPGSPAIRTPVLGSPARWRLLVQHLGERTRAAGLGKALTCARSNRPPASPASHSKHKRQASFPEPGAAAAGPGPPHGRGPKTSPLLAGLTVEPKIIQRLEKHERKIPGTLCSAAFLDLTPKAHVIKGKR